MNHTAGAAPVAVFQGYDTVTGAGRSTAVTGEIQPMGGASGVTYRVCTDVSTLAQTLNVSQSLSVSFGSIGSVDEKMTFMRKLNVSTHSISIVVYARHVLGTDVATDVVMKQHIKPPQTKRSDIQKFFRSYGDSYVSSRTRGGEYYAVYMFYSETREEQQTLALEMKAHGIYEGVSVDAALQTKLSTFTSTTKIRAELHQNISGIQNPNPPDGNGIVAFALSFPSLVLDAPAIIGFEMDGYEQVPDFGDFGTVPAKRRYFVGTGLVDGLSDSLMRVQQLRNQIAWLQNIYKFYPHESDAKLNAAATQAQTDLAAINDQIQQWEDDPVQSFTTPKLPSLDLGLPSLDYAIAYSPTFGGGGGYPIIDIDPRTYIQRLTSISSIQLRGARYVDKLTVMYRGSSGVEQFKHGGDGGDDSALLTLLPGQFVTRVGGRGDVYVDSLTVTISDGRTVGVGGRDGNGYDWVVPSGSFVLGFGGRAHNYLNQLQVIYATLHPAKWQ